jgi:uncharacterized membrane protein YhfC
MKLRYFSLLMSFASTSLRSKRSLMWLLSISLMLLLLLHLPHQKKVAPLTPNRILHNLMSQSTTLFVVEAVVDVIVVEAVVAVAVVVAILTYSVKCAPRLAIVP